jgi:hypothetical protein
MAVATGAVGRRKNQEKQAAAKSKREKVMLAGAGVVLLAVLAIELPSVLGGSSTPPAPAPTLTPALPPAAAVAGGAQTPATIHADLKEIASLPDKDPFQPQLATGTAPTTVASLAKGPHVRGSHFRVKNPFKVQLAAAQASTAAAAPLAKPPAVTAASKNGHSAVAKAPAKKLGFIVILRSLDSKAAAEREVRKAHAQGLVSAAVLYSSKYTTLRHGYWVVYLNKYPSMAAATSGLQQARAHGYGSAYRRPVKK